MKANKTWNSDYQTWEVPNSERPYRSKFACFTCKQAYLKTLVNQTKRVYCTNCGKELIDRGYLFESPKKQDIQKWKIDEILAQNGFRYHRVGMIVKISSFLKRNNLSTPKQVQTYFDQYNK